MLELAGHDGLAVEIGNLLDFEGTLEGGRELAAATEQKQGLLVLESLGAQLLDGLVLGEDVLDLAADLSKTLHDLLATLLLGGAVFAKRKGEHDHGNELRRVCLGGGDTNLGAGVDVNTAVGEEGDGRANNVDDTDGQSTALQTVAEGHERVSGLAGLRHEHAGVVAEDGGLSVEEVGCELDGDGDLGQLLENATNGHA